MSGPDNLDSVHWNLADLLGGRTVDELLDEALERATAFAERHRGALASLDGAELGEAMAQLAEIYDLVGRAGSYAQLDFSVDTADPARGALLARVEERSTVLATELLFFDLEWAALDDERVDELLASDALDDYRHHLRVARRYRPHLLSEPEERILTEKAVSGRSAWARLFEEVTAAIEVALEEPATLDVALARLASPSREVRRESAEAVTRALEPGLRTRAFAFNTLLADKATDDRLRSYPHWLAARNLDNEASDESVQALIAAVQARYELPRRWYRLKARLLGLERLADYDRMAPLSTGEEEAFDWPTARDLVLDAYEAFSPTLGALVRTFFEESWIDAPPSSGKRGGAFCSYTVPSVHPYVMLNFTGRRRDVLVLAHELGHGVHAALAAAPEHLPPGDAADGRRDRVGVRRGAHLLAPARGLADAAGAPGAARARHRRLDRDRLPPGRAEPLRGRRAHRAPRGGRALGRALQRAVGADAGRSARRRRRAHRRATGRGGPTSITSSERRATSTRTPTASCSRCRCSSATSRRARASRSATSSCWPQAGRAARRSSARSSASTCATRRSGIAGSTFSSAASSEAEAAAG